MRPAFRAAEGSDYLKGLELGMDIFIKPEDEGRINEFLGMAHPHFKLLVCDQVERRALVQTQDGPRLELMLRFSRPRAEKVK